ncbi:MAG: adenosylcobinamide-GDP ribazoletransferase, partial [Alphaproteobacteria bacterium]
IGAFGALALVLVTLARWSALAALIGRGPAEALAALAAAGALSRLGMGAVLAALPPARPDGLGRGAGAVPPAALGLGALIALALGLVLLGSALWAALLAAAAVTAALAMIARHRLGGQTGDVLGAVQVLAETAVLAAA